MVVGSGFEPAVRAAARKLISAGSESEKTADSPQDAPENGKLISLPALALAQTLRMWDSLESEIKKAVLEILESEGGVEP